MTIENASVVQAMTYLAWADGRLDPREEDMLYKFYLLLGLSEQEARASLVPVDKEPDYSELTRIFPTPTARRHLMKMLLGLSFADSQVSAKEFTVVKKVAKVLEMSKADLDQLRKDVQR